jgi:hypothetical protein
MARLYAAARLHVNFFQPSFKLREKRREGAKVIKRYHPPATPYERALAHPGWADGQRRATLLAALARLAAQAGNTERARAALDELDAIPELTLGNRAEQARARAELASAQGDLPGAELALRQSIACWLELGARVHAAHARLRLCELLLATDDPIAAELELTAAESVFASVNAETVLERCRALRKSLPS